MLTISQWPLTAGSGSDTTDGDLGSFSSSAFLTASFTNSTIVAVSTSTYGQLMVRVTSIAGSQTGNQVVAVYTSGSDTFNLASGINLFTLTTGKTLSSVQLVIAVNTTVVIDFVLFFKERLTLPTAIQPLQEKKTRNIVEIPILAREGGQQQDLGSMSSEYTIGGGLVNTTSGQSGWTNTYTADQWWQLLKGLVLETGTIQADGNPTWQWLASDELNGKVLPRGTALQQVPGRANPPGYHNYVFSMKQYDVLAESTANLPGISY